MASTTLLEYSKEFRAIAVVGPRQSGKTTLVKKVFPNKPYVSLENPDERLLAESDARAFLSRFPDGAIIDEAQRSPGIFSYLQQILDESQKDGMFILTGSNNFLLNQSLSQTLAGRIGYIDLLPLSYTELSGTKFSELTTNQLIYRGFYPEIYDRDRSPKLWFQAYIRTYIERDVKQIRNIENTVLFNRFIQLCAGRVGQQLNVSALSVECGVDVRTVNSWLGVLQAGYVIFLTPPYHKNYKKRVVKTPKLYFYDTGLACALLGIANEQELAVSHFRGALFENLVLIEALKRKYNSGAHHSLFYWRDNKGLEVDLIIEKGMELFPVEIKSAQTFQPSLVAGLKRWMNISQEAAGYLVYDGELEFTSDDGITVNNWRNMNGIAGWSTP